MIRQLADTLCDLATFSLPRGRETWAEVMKSDLGYITNDWQAICFSFGCLLAGLKERIKDFDTRFALGFWSMSLLTAGFALYHIQCAWRGVTIIMGRHDTVYQALLNGSAEEQLLAETYQAAVPIVASLILVLGISHLVAAYFLGRMQLRRFVFAYCFGLLIAIAAVSVQLSIMWTLRGIPSEFIALTVQALVIPALLLWSNGRHKHSHE